jgi:DNA-binding LytR/AlgR family response regulator
MERSLFFKEKIGISLSSPGKNTASTNTSSKVAKASIELIRFEEKRDVYIWVQPEDILFVKSADHYVKSLIQHGTQKKWTIRHCTIKDLLAILTDGDFVRLNKFYILNRNYFSSINKNEKTLYLDGDFSVPVPHRISRYVLELLKHDYT